jgi:hypothetical protein
MLAEELAWRRKEILGVRLLLRSTPNEAERGMLRRFAVPMLYGHWEGFVKEAATRYVVFVQQQRLPALVLRTNFLLLSVHSQLKEAAQSARASSLSGVLQAIASPSGSALKFPYRGVINTESNLSSDVLRNILFCCGIEFGDYWVSKALLLDASL